MPSDLGSGLIRTEPAVVVGGGSLDLPASAPPLSLDTVEAALAEIAAGRPVIVVDDENRESGSDLIMAADAVTPEWMAFTVRHTSGLVYLPLTGAVLDRLGIPAMVHESVDRLQTGLAVSVDASSGVTTGISARDRARTARLLADPRTEPGDLTRPGHLLPLRTREGGVLVRPGHAEAAVDLARLAGRQPAGVIAEMVEDDGSMRRADSCRAFADEHHLVMISIQDLRDHRLREEGVVRRVVSTSMPTRPGVLTAVGYIDQQSGTEHLALVAGLGADGHLPDGDDVLVRIHSACLTGEVLSSSRCDCGPQLDASIEKIATAGRGVVVYLRGHEESGTGLLATLRACSLQDRGLDTVEAGTRHGMPVDARHRQAAADILTDLAARRVRLLTDDLAEVTALSGHGIHVSARLPLAVGAPRDNVRLLATRRDRTGHHLVEVVSGAPPLVVGRAPLPTWSRPDDAVPGVG
ncbi:GTP cyclohydrolase II /3,4-dihydroxy-2-butanone 4-phosphate synthase [Geodermatophilus amargosae]|uniref:GTP cyclohydrolase II /3,4-dihydroxy-2-butanone 4-phosphate synthase n=1 Tax=Geodermatophilus amargosae TaxID=1296565 RepID=A0A1I7B571_9ACTN|nr:GTP cyclohydrolase II /3,4-dihydroxy-2-butanone 4-phosphate synthase [Geodermatophilus amargosae]